MGRVIRTMTIQQAAQQALDIQDTSNLSGVVFAFADAMQAVCHESSSLGFGTKWKNTHPIVTMHLLKLCEMNGCGSTLDETYGPAEEACKLLAAVDLSIAD